MSKTIKQIARAIGIDATAIEVCGSRYLVTTGTGEMAYSLGHAAFVYDASDSTDAAIADYTAFCDTFEPVGEDDPNWLDLAVALAARGERLTVSGSCTPALSDREYKIARLAAEL